MRLENSGSDGERKTVLQSYNHPYTAQLTWKLTCSIYEKLGKLSQKDLEACRADVEGS
jgi:hypothetical protein